MQSATCAHCTHLYNDSASRLLEYDIVLDAIAQTPRNDRAYANQWTALSKASERLYEAQRREQAHQANRHSS